MGRGIGASQVSADHQLHAQRDEPKRIYPHCNRYGWGRGDCRRLACSRCGAAEMERLRRRIEAAAACHERIFFVTVYLDYKIFPDYKQYGAGGHDAYFEKVFDHYLKKLIRAMRDMARKAGESLEYVAIMAFGKVRNRIHKHAHSHVLCSWLPSDIIPHRRSKNADRLQSRILDATAKKVYLTVWVEKPRSMGAVVRYSVQNLESAISQKWAKKMKLVRLSKGFEKC